LLIPPVLRDLHIEAKENIGKNGRLIISVLTLSYLKEGDSRFYGRI
jgi:hypothetical protein